jgi:hypothetical protein
MTETVHVSIYVDVFLQIFFFGSFCFGLITRSDKIQFLKKLFGFTVYLYSDRLLTLALDIASITYLVVSVQFILS